ncbi:hypothetical protein COO60DRAFT_1461853 [Scenedesmus sp. NREL 46B-D3]|nr:hypothetical protein COO60DRAFT_1461853 [Scenedesmus sp. NREL 46B-D3]
MLQTSRHKQLVQHMQELLLQYMQQRYPGALESLTPEEQQRQLLEVLHSDNLLQFQEVYWRLNAQLQGLRVRAQLGSSFNTYDIAFLDPRSPADILTSGPQGVTHPISCLDHNSRKYPGSELRLTRNAAGRPLLPCITVQLKKEARHGKQLQQCFISYPVEACCRWQPLPVQQHREKAVMRRTLDAVSHACEQIRLNSPDTGMRWNVASVIKAGSFEKATGLRRNGDLDVVLKLRCHGGACFDSCRRELLAAVEQQLCSEASADAAASPAAGWRSKQCHTEHFLRLEHRALHAGGQQLQLDLQARLR